MNYVRRPDNLKPCSRVLGDVVVMPRDSAFVEFVQSASPGLFRFAALLTQDPERAQDLVQEALVGLYVRWPKIESGDPFAYARRSIVNKNRSYWRRRPWRLVSVIPMPDGPDLHDAIALSDTRATLTLGLKDLAPREREVVVLRFLEDLSERDTAEAMGVTIGTIKSTTSRALHKLSRSAAFTQEPEPTTLS